METGMVKRNPNVGVLAVVNQMAPIMHQSRLFGVNNSQQAAAIMLKGYELGMGLAASFEYIHIIQGKPTLSPRGHLALIMQSGQMLEMRIDDGDEYCEVYMKRKDGFAHTIRYTMQEARDAGLVKPNSAWIGYPKNMLRWRAIGFCADVVFPDLSGGMKRSDELGGLVSPDGEVIEGEYAEVTEPASSDTEYAGNTPGVSLSQLIDTWGPQVVLEACRGQIPQTDAEVVELANLLAEREMADVAAG